jgi:transporter family protein
METMLYIIVAIMFWGIGGVFDKLSMNKGEPITGMAIRSFVVFVSLVAIIAFSGKTGLLISTVRNDAKTTLYFAISGICAGLIAMLAYFAALRLAPASQVIPVTSIYPLITVLLCVLFLKERLATIQSFGILLVIAGVYLVQLKK